MISRRSKHRDEPRVDGRPIHSGGSSAHIVRGDDAVAIGHGADHILWVLVLDPVRRPRGHERIDIEAAPVRVEPKGLVRVLDRRVPWPAIKRLLVELSVGDGTLPPSRSLDARIPDGNHDGVRVTRLDRFYRVEAGGRGAKRFAALAIETLGEGRFLVQPGEEPQVRRARVARLMPMPLRFKLAVRGRLGRAARYREQVAPCIARTVAAPGGGASVASAEMPSDRGWREAA